MAQSCTSLIELSASSDTRQTKSARFKGARQVYYTMPRGYRIAYWVLVIGFFMAVVFANMASAEEIYSQTTNATPFNANFESGGVVIDVIDNTHSCFNISTTTGNLTAIAFMLWNEDLYKDYSVDVWSIGTYADENCISNIDEFSRADYGYSTTTIYSGMDNNYLYLLGTPLDLNGVNALSINIHQNMPYNDITADKTGYYGLTEYYPYAVVYADEVPAEHPEGGSAGTRIIEILPEEATTTDNPVEFYLHAYISPDDIGSVLGIKITLHNIDQNLLLFKMLSPDDIYLFEGLATTTGHFHFSDTATLTEGNYRIEACLERTYWGAIANPFANIIDGAFDCQSNQFIVGTSTFVGHISQNIWGETNEFFSGLTATSSEALASSCNPLSGNFEIRECLAYLFIPDASSLDEIMKEAREAVLLKMPWGYAVRFVDILTSSSTSTLPSFTVNIRGGNGEETPENMALAFDMNDIITGGGDIVDSISDPIYGKTFKDVFDPLVKLVVALGVVLTIASDLLKSHPHTERHTRTQET